MNREEFNTAMNEFGPPLPDAAEALIWIAADRNHLTGLPFNFVPVGDGLYEILQPDDRGGKFQAAERHTYDGIFRGTLGEAYQWVYDDYLRYWRRHAGYSDGAPSASS